MTPVTTMTTVDNVIGGRAPGRSAVGRSLGHPGGGVRRRTTLWGPRFRGDEAVTFRAVGLVPDNVVGKVAAAREHRDPGLGSRTLQFDRAESDKAAEDGDDLGAGVSVTTS